MDGLTSRAFWLFGCVGARATRLPNICRASRFRQLPTALALLLYCAFAPTSGQAQTTAVLQGIVTDRTTSLPLANVSVYDTTNGVPLATTDPSGSFSLTAAQLGNATAGTLYFQLATYFARSQTFDLTQSASVSPTLLAAGTVVQGTLTDAVSGSPVPQVPITLGFFCTFEPCSIGQNTTAGQGFDHFAGLTNPDGTYQFDASLFLEDKFTSSIISGASALSVSNSQVPGYYSNSTAVVLMAPAPNIANLALIPIAGTTIGGIVTDRATTQPVAGVQVYLNTPTNLVTTTDANGSYSIPGSLLGGVPGGQLIFRAAGYFASINGFGINTQGAVLNQSLLTGALLDGTVTDASTQAPIAGITLDINLECPFFGTCLTTSPPSSSGTITAITDLQGHYSLDISQIYEQALTATAPFNAVSDLVFDGISLTGAGYLTEGLGNFDYLTPATPIHRDFALTPSTNFAVQGTITDRASGLPVIGAQIYFLNFDRPIIATTDGNGNYSVPASAFFNSSTGQFLVRTPGYFIGTQPFDLTGVGTSTYTLNTTLLPGGTFLKGRVSDAATGLSINGAIVSFDGTCTYPSPCGAAPGQPWRYFSLNLVATSGGGGLYTIDSSQIFESALSSLVLTDESSCTVTSTAYPCSDQTVSIGFTPGSPTTVDFPLTSNGTTVAITIDTAPTGLAITVDGVAATAPQTYTWTPANEHVISTTSPQSPTPGSPPAVFAYWTDQLAMTHVLVVPNSGQPAPYVATFDTAAPAITPTLSGTLGSNGWYTSIVSLTWSVVDNVAPVTSTSGCEPAAVASDTTGQTFTCSATGLGGMASQSVTIKRDATRPDAGATRSPLPNANGWNNSTVKVNFTGRDATSGIASCSPPVTMTTQGAHQSSASGTCTDKAGNVSKAVMATNINIDETPPVVTGTASPAPNGNGWNNTAVTVTFTATDELSGVAANGCVAPVVLSTNGSGQSVTGSCSDQAGNSASATVTGINIDTIPPTTVATAIPGANANGWNNSTVTVSFGGADSLGGSGMATCSPSVMLPNAGAGQTASGICTDGAGNTSAVASKTVNIDETPPVVSITTPANGGSYPVGSTVNSAYGCVDALSGVSGCVGTVANGSAIKTSATGTYGFSVTGTDAAGNTATSSVTYTVVATTPAFTAKPNPLAFNDEAVKVSSAPLSITVTSTGGKPVSITGVSITGTNANQFSQSNNCVATLAVGSICTINVVFTPTTVGAKSASVSITGTGVGTQTVALTGTGVVPTYTLNPTTLVFTNQPHGTTSASQLITLINTGPVAVPITGITIMGGQFSEINTCGKSVGVSATCSISVVFMPTTKGAKSSALKVAAGGGAATETVALSGTGT